MNDVHDSRDDRLHPIRSAATVADYLLIRAGIPLTSIHVNKIVYIMHAWCLAAFDRSLISEDIEAWTYGPVVPALYYIFRKYGKTPITELSQCNTRLTDTANIETRKQSLQNQFDKNEIKIMDEVIESHKNYSASELIEITHEKNGPWEKTYKKKEQPPIIPNELIKKHYRKY